MSKIYDVFNRIENVVIGTGVCVSLATIENILSIILLSVNVILIIAKVVIKVVDKLKHGDVDGAVKDLQDGQDELKDIKK